MNCVLDDVWILLITRTFVIFRTMRLPVWKIIDSSNTNDKWYWFNYLLSTSSRSDVCTWSIAYDYSRHFSRCKFGNSDNPWYWLWYSLPFRNRQRISPTTFWLFRNRLERDNPCRMRSWKKKIQLWMINLSTKSCVNFTVRPNAW